MAIHMVSLNDSGELISVWYQCSESCMKEELENFAPEDITPGVVEYGAYPGSSETDYNVYCSNCGALLWHGLVNADSR